LSNHHSAENDFFTAKPKVARNITPLRLSGKLKITSVGWFSRNAVSAQQPTGSFHKLLTSNQPSASSIPEGAGQ